MDFHILHKVNTNKSYLLASDKVNYDLMDQELGIIGYHFAKEFAPSDFRTGDVSAGRSGYNLTLELTEDIENSKENEAYFTRAKPLYVLEESISLKNIKEYADSIPNIAPDLIETLQSQSVPVRIVPIAHFNDGGVTLDYALAQGEGLKVFDYHETDDEILLPWVNNSGMTVEKDGEVFTVEVKEDDLLFDAIAYAFYDELNEKLDDIEKHYEAIPQTAVYSIAYSDGDNVPSYIREDMTDNFSVDAILAKNAEKRRVAEEKRRTPKQGL